MQCAFAWIVFERIGCLGDGGFARAVDSLLELLCSFVILFLIVLRSFVCVCLLGLLLSVVCFRCVVCLFVSLVFFVSFDCCLETEEEEGSLPERLTVGVRVVLGAMISVR